MRKEVYKKTREENGPKTSKMRKNVQKMSKYTQKMHKKSFFYCVQEIFFVPLRRKTMKQKAVNNLEAAKCLILKHLPTESVHCLYYAVFQYMMYMLKHTDRNPLTYEKQKELTQGKDSHILTLQEIKNRMIGKPSAIKNFYDTVIELKNARVTADYATDPISEDDTLGYQKKAEGIISKLKQNFGNL